ncbi:MAG: AAA family ATPase [Geobacteraceae bacterium]|nr:AAA family ATPase [Geobacteraceae bacterium]
MRILRLRFRNLNSLAGDWDIDFTHPAYVSSGIFAITGPTGAGKTTILDGICLSLYGQTPRLNKITQSENEIMSRQTGECSAEVEFETAKGRFRCHWSQHRSRKQADGQLQAPKHEIADAESGTILESKLKAVAAKVEEVTGMDFDRFTRSMLLAQGGFAAFLQARPDERAPILEQITGTAIYSRISIKVHELTTEERRRLEALRADLNGMQLLSPEEEAGLRSELVEKEREEAGLTAVAHEIREQKAWQERIAALETEFAQIEQAWHSFEEKKVTAVPELEQLAKGSRALALDGDYVNFEGIRKQQEAEQAGLASACARLPKVQQARQAAADLLEKAEACLQNSRTEQAREAELIRKTRELDVKLDEARSRIEGLEIETEKLKVQRGAYRTAITNCDEQMGEAGTALQSAEAFLAEHRADAGLVEALTGIEQQVKTLKVLGGQCAERRKQLDRQADGCKNAEQAKQLAETAWQEAVQAVAAAENRLGKVRAERETLLQGRELAAWRTGAEALATRLNRLQTLHQTVARVEETSQRLETLKLRQETLEVSRQELARQEEALSGERGLRDEMVRQLQDKVVLLNRVRDLEAERAQLVDGAPCPLCGATEHPYATGNLPCPDETKQELELACKAAKEISERLSAVRAEQAGVLKELEQAGRERSEYQGVVERDEALCAAVLVELELSAASAARSEAILTESDACREELAGCRAVIGQVEQSEEERGAKAAYDSAREVLAGQDKACQAAALGFERAVSERGRLERECAALRDDLDRALAELERAGEPYGCKDISLQNAEQMLAALTKRRSAHGERLQEKERLAKRLADLGSEMQKQQALLAEAEKNLAEREGLVRDRLAQRAELAGSRLELFGDRNPDSEEKRLADALKEAGERRDAAWRDQNRLQAELAGLEEEIRKQTIAIAARKAELAELAPVLYRRMSEAGFADEAAFLQARLPQARFAELSRQADALRREETEIQTRRQDRAATLQMELDKRLTGKTLDQVREEDTAITMQLSELQKALGALGQKLQLHSEQLELQQTRLQAVEMQKKECARWERLHELIGSADGKKFRNFAQGLTFELMVAHANRQLQKMSDRYILGRDSDEPLELNVIDNYQAGEIRSTKNLSGGESFIVSLALALGLSNMASRNVAVDSLFLDEGFGTLDEDALETALETLSGLQQDGKLIGIISHVPALKERIGTQIQVEAGNAGRSSLSGPGCRRVV